MHMNGHVKGKRKSFYYTVSYTKMRAEYVLNFILETGMKRAQVFRKMYLNPFYF